MIAKETYIRARIDMNLKEESERILESLGMTTSEAIRVFLNQVRLRRAIPFDLRLDDNADILMPAKSRQAALDSVYDD